MVLLPAILASLAFMIAVVSILVICLCISKTGLTIVAARMKLKSYGLLWLPVFGSWYEATIVSKFIDNNKGIRAVYFIINLITLILLGIMFSIPYNLEIQDTFTNITYTYMAFASVAKGIIRVIAMKKHGYGVIAAICINYFLPICWSYFMIGKTSEVE